MKERYRSFSSYLKGIFKEKVYRVTVNAGLSCPNRLKGKGCIYCYLGSSYDVEKAKQSIKEQIKNGIERVKKRYGANKFLVYFQAYTNTFAPLNALKEIYDEVKQFEDVVGIIIGTRPDCVPDDVLELINSYTKDYLVWIEYGLESSHFKSLKWMKRGHGVSDFVDAVIRTRKYKDINICSHIILGLPTEDEEDMLETADLLSALKIDGIKIHPLHIIKNTELERIYLEERFNVLKLEEYVSLVTKFIERLHPKTIIQRLTGEAPEELLIAPYWCSHREKNRVIQLIRDELEKRNTYQGAKCRFR
jgi:radical SAM protein (TIGR01212 family)